jgi:predicted enzyme related to lactoylglutathione lyase
VNDGHDPLDALRTPVAPVVPDAAFAARLRARLRLAVLDPTGVTMTGSDSARSGTAVTVPPVPAGEGDVVYSSLWVPDVVRAENFYRAALGWVIEPRDHPRGRAVVGVARTMGMWGDVPDSTLFLCHAVDDLRAAVARVRAAGGVAEEPVRESHGLMAACTDNQGMRFSLIEAPSAQRAPAAQAGVGELQYLTVGVPDADRYREFYGAVFGWTFTGRPNGGWEMDGVRPMGAVRGGAERSVVVPMYGVADVAASVAAIRAAGGTATEPQQMPYGTTADCVDDQGMPFYIGQA